MESQRITLPSPGTHEQLEALAGRLHSELLDRVKIDHNLRRSLKGILRFHLGGSWLLVDKRVVKQLRVRMSVKRLDMLGGT